MTTTCRACAAAVRADPARTLPRVERVRRAAPSAGLNAGLNIGMIAGLIVGAAAGLMAGGCAKPPPALSLTGDEEHLWALHRTRVEAVSAWRVEGKVGIRNAGRLWQGGVHWLHEEGGDSMDLLEPGGRTWMRLSGRAGSARAVDGTGRAYRAESFDELAADVLGVEVPVSSLRYWIVGVPAPGAPISSARINRDGRAGEFDQNGWRVSYLEYRPVEIPSLQPLALPSLLVLTRGGVKVTVAAKRWRLLKFAGGGPWSV